MIPGYAMFSVTSKLKELKKPLKKLKYSQGDLAEKVKILKEKLCKVKEEMVKDPSNAELRFKEFNLLKDFNSTVKVRSYF